MHDGQSRWKAKKRDGMLGGHGHVITDTARKSPACTFVLAYGTFCEHSSKCAAD